MIDRAFMVVLASAFALSLLKLNNGMPLRNANTADI